MPTSKRSKSSSPSRKGSKSSSPRVVRTKHDERTMEKIHARNVKALAALEEQRRRAEEKERVDRIVLEEERAESEARLRAIQTAQAAQSAKDARAARIHQAAAERFRIMIERRDREIKAMQKKIAAERKKAASDQRKASKREEEW